MSSERPSNNNLNLLQKTDPELFLLLQQGQTEVLAILYDRHAALVYGIALQLFKNTTEAEDLTQDIFLKLASDRSYDPQRGSLRTFLAILTRCRAMDRLRAQTRLQKQLQKQALDQKSQVNSTVPIEELSQVERSQEIREALARLSSREQEILKMAYFEGLTQSEIATKLDTALGTVKSRSRRGLLKLRQALIDMEKS